MLNRWIWITFSLLVLSIIARGYLEYQDTLNTNARDELTVKFNELMEQLDYIDSSPIETEGFNTPSPTEVPIETVKPYVPPNRQSEEKKKKILAELRSQFAGEIEIPRIGLEYIILNEATVENLKISITKFHGPAIHEKGNLVLTGHNMYDGSFFGYLKVLQNGDIVILKDLQGISKEYTIFDQELVREDNLSPLYKYGNDGTYVTLITCDSDDEFRLVKYAKLRD